MRHQTTQKLAVVFIVLVIAFVVAFLFLSSENPTSSPNASASPSPTGAQSPSQVQAGSEQPRQNANPSPPAPTEIKKNISGIVRRESPSEAAVGSVIGLFNAERRGADPQTVDAAGRYQFKDIPLRPGATYSLQVKAPGLCGEENFTVDANDSSQAINRDIVLKPCQILATGALTTATQEDPGLQRISENLSAVPGPLKSIKFWFQILTTTWILILIMLLLATMIVVLHNRREAEHQRLRVNDLWNWKERIDGEVKKLSQQREPLTATLSLPSGISENLLQLIAVLTPLLAATGPAGSRTPNSDSNPNARPEAWPQAESPKPQIQRRSYSDSTSNVNDWYRRLLQNELTSPAPIYVEIHSSDANLMNSDRRIRFDERPNHGPFVIYAKSDDTGWIFPAPNTNYMGDHHRVFDELDAKNFKQQLASITPKEVLFEDGRWQLVLP